MQSGGLELKSFINWFEELESSEIEITQKEIFASSILATGAEWAKILHPRIEFTRFFIQCI